MTAEPFRILQVGLGNRGRMWAEIIDGRADVVHSGIVDVDPARLAPFQAMHPDVSVFSELAVALAESASDAVLLVTPPDGHLAQAQLTFDAGLPLLAEKPLTLDLAEAVTIVELAEAAEQALMVGLNFRYLSVTRKLRELVAEGRFGRPGFGQFTYQRNRDGRLPRLNKYPLTMEHPMMLEQSIHHLDLIRFCYDREVETVRCRTWNPPWSMYAHDSNVSCLLTLEGGLEVNYLGTWTGGWNQLQFEWRTDCEAGVMIQRQLFDDLAVAHVNDAELTAVPLAPCEPFYDDTDALLSAFIAHVATGAPLECSGRDHLRTLALCFAAIESSATGATIDMAAYNGKHGIS
jgi:predicted dehydrogenase